MSTPTDAEIAARAWQSLRTLVLDRHERRREVCEALGMSFIRAKALRRLAKGGLSMRDLATELQTDAPYTTVIVDDLEKRALVERTVHPDDRRSKIVTVTPAGRRAARQADKILSAPPAVLRDLPPRDLAALDRIATRLLTSSD